MTKKKNSKIKHSPRYLAMVILTAIETEGAYSNLLLNGTIEKENLNEQDVRFLTELVYGVTQRKLTLDYGLSPFIRQPRKLEAWVRNLLRISAYQMFYLDKVPDHAIIYEAAEIAKQKGHAGIVKMVNGILRNLQRKGFKKTDEIKDPIERISVEASVPLWLVESFAAQIGTEKTEKMFLSLLEKPYVSIRVQKAEEMDAVIKQLKSEGIETEKSPISPTGLRVIKGKVVASTPFEEGKITIQDESSQLVALVGQLSPSFNVLDACAAPGGKTVHMASYLDAAEGGTVHALDIHEHKIQLIKQNTNRLGVTDRVHTHLLNAKEAGTQFSPASFDAVFVDAPCSGLGLMRRKPEIKYNVEEQTIDSLHQEQIEILAAVEPLLKQGGRLVYSTCTLAEKENQQTVAEFLKQNPHMKQVSLVEENHANRDWNLPSEIITDEGYIQIFPDAFTTDGFFICVMEKAE